MEPLISSDDHGLGPVVDALPAAVLVYSSRGLVYANPASEALTGYTAEELAGRSLWRLVHPTFQAEVRRGERRRLDGAPVPRCYEIQLRTKGGECRWVELSTRVVAWGGARVVLAFAVDIGRHRQAEISLRDREARLKLAQRAGRTITWDWDAASGEVLLSAAAQDIFAFIAGRQSLAGRELLRYVHRRDRRRLLAAVGRGLRQGSTLSVEIRLLPPEGELCWLLLHGRAVRSRRGRPVRIIGVATDITQRRQAEEALVREMERAQVTLRSIGDGVVRTDARGHIDYLNPAAVAMTGWQAAEARGRRLTEVVRIVDRMSHQPIPDPLASCLQGRESLFVPGKDVLLRRDGLEREIRHSTAPIRHRDGSSAGFVVVLRDLTELRTIEREVLYLATHDALTGLLNRTEFERRLAQALASAESEGRVHALFYLDLDQFKLVNDTCGHLAGDEMLGQIGSVLKCRFRDSDVLGRLGGDEFGVLLEGCPPERALEIGTQLCKDIRAFRFACDESIFSVGASVGLVVLGPGGGDVAQVLSAADAACYVAKEKGGDRVHQVLSDDADLAERYGQVQLVQCIHRALEAQSFELHRQAVEPLVGAPVYPHFYEILLRMVKADGERVEPTDFIPVAERHRLICPIDRWVVHHSLRWLAAQRPRWGDGFPAFALNLSGHSLSEESFLEFVVGELQAAAVSPAQLLFEITETASVSHLGRAMRFISALRGRGCRFVLDDFGTGLSSFAYLRNLPVDFIKIDGQFVRQVTRDPIQRALVESINHIGHVMQLKTIAESVEDEETFEALREMRVDYAQGFWIARPEPLEDRAERRQGPPRRTPGRGAAGG